MKKADLEVLEAIAAHGGVDVGTLQINTYIGGGAYTPIYFALKDLTKLSHLEEVCTRLNPDGTPRRGWSLTQSGATTLSAIRKQKIERRPLAWLMAFMPR